MAPHVPKTITSSTAFQDPQGNVLANGSITFDLSAPAEVTGGGQIVPTRVEVILTSAGLIPASTVIWANDQINPTNTVYFVSIYNSNGLLVSGPLFWRISGSSPIDLSVETPVSLATLSFSLPGMQATLVTGTGSSTFTIPTGVSALRITVVGAGGAGGGGGGTAAMGTGGGSGGAAISWLTGMTPGNTISVTVGTGGVGVSAANGGAGGLSSISSGTQTITTVTANGGAGGVGNTAGLQNGGGGGSASNGSVNFIGASASPAISTSVSASCGASSLFGGGGAIGGGGGGAPGAGGGGSSTNPSAGGNGANGIVIFEWVA